MDMSFKHEKHGKALLYVLEAAAEKKKKAKHQRAQIATFAQAVRIALKTVKKTTATSYIPIACIRW